MATTTQEQIVLNEQEIIRNFFNEENFRILQNQNRLDVLRQAASTQEYTEESQLSPGLAAQQQVQLPPAPQTSNQEEGVELSLTEVRHYLVDLMPSYPALWNTSLRSYKDLNKKDAAWKNISYQIKNVSSECVCNFKFTTFYSMQIACVTIWANQKDVIINL